MSALNKKPDADPRRGLRAYTTRLQHDTAALRPPRARTPPGDRARAGAVAPRAAVTHTQSRGPAQTAQRRAPQRAAAPRRRCGPGRRRGAPARAVSGTGVRGRGGRVRRGVRRSPRGGRRLEVRFEGAVARCAARAWAADRRRRRWRGFVVASAGWMRRNDFRAFSEDAGSWCSRVAARSRSPRARGSGAGGARGRGAACGMTRQRQPSISPNAV